MSHFSAKISKHSKRSCFKYEAKFKFEKRFIHLCKKAKNIYICQLGKKKTLQIFYLISFSKKEKRKTDFFLQYTSISEKCKNTSPNLKICQTACFSDNVIHVKCTALFRSTSLFFQFYCLFKIQLFLNLHHLFFSFSQAATSLWNLSILQELFSPLWVCFHAAL